jgi:hypothetical protein
MNLETLGFTQSYPRKKFWMTDKKLLRASYDPNFVTPAKVGIHMDASLRWHDREK